MKSRLMAEFPWAFELKKLIVVGEIDPEIKHT